MELYLIRHQLYIAGCLYLGQILVGYGLGWTAPVLPKLQDEDLTPLPTVINDQEASWIGSVLYIGTITGPYVTGVISNVKGRKPCLFLGATISILAFLVLAVASNLAMIYTGRILIGLGTGIIFVMNLVYIGEIASTHVRGILLTCTGIFSTFGTLIIYSVGPYVPYSATGYLGLALTLVYTLGIFFIPETPLFLVLKGERAISSTAFGHKSLKTGEMGNYSVVEEMELYLIRHQLYIAGCLYLGQILVGYGLGWTAPVLPKLQDEDLTPLPTVINDQEASWIGSVLYIGTITGPYVTGVISNVKGRKPCLFLGATISILAFLVLAVASNLAMIYTGRILIGLGTGIIFVMNLVYIGEIASTHVRGILLTCTGIFSTFGTLIIYSVGPYVPYSATGYLGLALTLVYTLGIFFIPETPLFLVLKGQENEARETLTNLGRAEEFEQVLLAKQELSKLKRSVKDQWTEIVTVRSNQRALLITLTLNILQQMSGVIAVVFFATRIFEMAESSIEPNLATIVIGITQIVASTITPFFVEWSGRKSLLLVSTAACCLSLGTLGTYFYLDHIGNPIVRDFGWLPLVTLIIFFLSYDLGFGIIPGTFIGEMFTPNVRSTGSTVTVTAGWLFGFFISSAFAVMVANGAHIAFWVYASACAIAFTFSVIFVPETKGKSLLDIQDMLSKSWTK